MTNKQVVWLGFLADCEHCSLMVLDLDTEAKCFAPKCTVLHRWCWEVAEACRKIRCERTDYVPVPLPHDAYIFKTEPCGEWKAKPDTDTLGHDTPVGVFFEPEEVDAATVQEIERLLPVDEVIALVRVIAARRPDMQQLVDGDGDIEIEYFRVTQPRSDASVRIELLVRPIGG